jgi:hypothetical protein
MIVTKLIFHHAHIPMDRPLLSTLPITVPQILDLYFIFPVTALSIMGSAFTFKHYGVMSENIAFLFLNSISFLPFGFIFIGHFGMCVGNLGLFSWLQNDYFDEKIGNFAMRMTHRIDFWWEKMVTILFLEREDRSPYEYDKEF